MGNAGNYKIGETSWDEEQVSSQRSANKKIPFLRMDHNKNYKIRIVSKPYRHYYKWVRNADGKNVKLNSSLTEDCPLCVDGKEPDVGWYARVLYRDGGKVIPAVLDFGKQIMSGIKDCQKNPDYGEDLHSYDLTIMKGVKGSQPLYRVQPSPPKPLIDDEKAMAKAINKKEIDGEENPDFIDLEERCKPLPVETLRKILSGEQTPSEESSSGPDESGVFEEETPQVAPKKVVKSVKASPVENVVEENTESVKANDEDFLDF